MIRAPHMILLLGSAALLSACPSPTPPVPCIAQVTPSTDCMRQLNDAKAQSHAAVNAGKHVQFSEPRRLAMAVESALQWLDVSPERRLQDAEDEARFLRSAVIRPRISPCLSPMFDDLLAKNIHAGLTDTALANAIALQWSHAYTDAQLAEIHRVALSGGTMAQLNPALFTGNAPTDASVTDASTLAARRIYRNDPPALGALVRDWATQHPAPVCKLPTTETEWHNVLDYAPLYRGDAW